MNNNNYYIIFFGDEGNYTIIPHENYPIEYVGRSVYTIDDGYMTNREYLGLINKIKMISSEERVRREKKIIDDFYFTIDTLSIEK
jgi:hypothetical protein